MATSVFSEADPPLPARPEGTQASVDDLRAMLRGTREFMRALGKVFPSVGDEELCQLAVDIEGSAVATRLLHMVFELKKIKV